MGVFPLKHVSHVVKYNGVLWVTDFHGIKRISRSWEEFLKLQSGIHSVLLTRRPSVAITICSSASWELAVLLLDWAIMMKKILLKSFFSLLEFIFQIQTERSHTGQPARRRNLQTSNPSTRELRHCGVFTAPGINPSTRGVVCKIGCITYIRWSTSCPTLHISWCRKSGGSEEDVCSKIQPSLNSRIRKGREERRPEKEKVDR